MRRDAEPASIEYFECNVLMVLGDVTNMRDKTRGKALRLTTLIASAAAASLLAGCTSSGTSHSMTTKKRSSEYFAESEYGVKASPRVSNKRSRLPRGGGRDQTGKPYKVRGVWYHPKEDRNYKKVGAASWYGDAFHGRLTANGEIYDMTHLTAAHPTMPLPSYARVTNMKNGSSVVVRVNDRGPYAHGRIIDLSKRAADMLDYAHSGVAKVKVEYVGRAPLDGQDEQYLVASYRPGDRAPDPSDGLPSGVMIAMNGTTPSGGASSGAFPGLLADAAAHPASSFGASDIALPDFGPIAPERPLGETQMAFAVMSYAEQGPTSAVSAFAALERATQQATDTADSGEVFVAVGTFASREEAETLAQALRGKGRIALETSDDAGRRWFTLNLYPDGHGSADELLEAAWSNGATDAIVVRD
jgi:rare lipoprotein A